MARPAPRVLLSSDDGLGITKEVIQGSGIWTLSYKGEPVQLREVWFDENGQRYHYPRCTYNNPGHCHRLAEKMNELYGNDDFECLEYVVASK